MSSSSSTNSERIDWKLARTAVYFIIGDAHPAMRRVCTIIMRKRSVWGGSTIPLFRANGKHGKRERERERERKFGKGRQTHI